MTDAENLETTPTPKGKLAWGLILKRAFFNFSRRNGTDMAAGLTYYSLLSLFPALIASVSLIGVLGNGKATTDALIKVVAGVAGAAGTDESRFSGLRSMIDGLQTVEGAGIAFVFGVLAAIWSASAYVNGFSRSLNVLYGVQEGRSTVRLRLTLYGVTAVQLVLVIILALSLVMSGSVAHSIGSVLGWGHQSVTVWNWVKWPFVVALVTFVIGFLYYAAPNVKRSAKAIFSWGAFFAFIVWAVGSAAFGFYISNFASYGKTYGVMAGAVMFLLWLWITNNAMLLGAAVDAEVLRVRQVRARFSAAKDLVIVTRSDAASLAVAEKEKALVAASEALVLPEYIAAEEAAEKDIAVAEEDVVEDPAIDPEQVWESVELGRARYAKPVSRERRAVRAEQAARRAQYFAAKEQGQAAKEQNQ